MSKPIKIIKNILLIIIILVVSLIFIIRMDFYISNMPKERCLKQNGKWVKSVVPNKYYCSSIPATDNGKPCTDNEQCQGNCIPKDESINICLYYNYSRSPKDKNCVLAEGTCSEFKSRELGCHSAGLKDGMDLGKLCSGG